MKIFRGGKIISDRPMDDPVETTMPEAGTTKHENDIFIVSHHGDDEEKSPGARHAHPEE
jgi:hypothetical protein